MMTVRQGTISPVGTLRHIQLSFPMRRGITLMILLSVVVIVSCSRPSEPDPRLVQQWVRTWYGAIRVERLSPPVASRLMVYANTALYAGMVAVRPDLPSLTGAMNGIPELPRADHPRRHDETITAVEAERVVMDSLFDEALPTTKASLSRLADSLVRARVAAGVPDAVRERSESLGRRIGLGIVAWSRTDGFDGTRGRPYAAPVGPGLWINDAPGNVFATQSISGASEFVALDNPANQQRATNTSDRGLILSRPKSAAVRNLPAVNMSGASEPYWNEIRPFVLERWDACPITAPPAFATDSGSELYKNAKAVLNARAALTDEQRSIAFYWADNAGESGTPVGHWLAIASQMVHERALPADEAARLVLATSTAMADAFIASWGYKYQYSLIRPRTYIRRVLEPAWEPLIPTPPFPEYPSSHSTQSAAAAETIGALLGDAPFEDSTNVSLGHAARSFPTFRAAADEAGLSRIYGGIHFPVGDQAGREVGACIGAKVSERFSLSPAP